MNRWLLVLTVLCVFAPAAAAQTSTISGTVIDPSGAVVPGANVANHRLPLRLCAGHTP